MVTVRDRFDLVTLWKGMWKRIKRYASFNKEPQVSENTSLPKVILSANDEIGREESSIPVMMQRACACEVMPSTVADILCADLGVDGMLQKLNINAASVCTPDSPLYKACEYFIAENYDLGTAYAHLRPHLYDFNTDIHVMEAQRKDEEMRQNLLSNKKITNGDAPPRRVWDLHANRVVPWWVAHKYPWAISHAWLDETDRKREMTPINGYEWPVPMPKDADLKLIRIEMLNLGAEYVWLDVLCLRQERKDGDPRGNPSQKEWKQREALRKEEWKVDLPTIGWIYHKAEKVVCYFSGLGLPLSFKPGDFESDLCWFNRAWTLQETRSDLLVAGKTDIEIGSVRRDLRNLIFLAKTSNDDRIEEKFMTKCMQDLFDEKLASLRQMDKGTSVFHILSQMRNRKSTKPVDIVAGLVYLFYSQYIPIYDAHQSKEDAWTELVNVTQIWFRADLFFLYPTPGGRNKIWHPSWEQVMGPREILPKGSLGAMSEWSPQVDQTNKDGDKYYGPRIDSCRVRGLAHNSTPEMLPRHGHLDVTNDSGEKHTFEIVANHTFQIHDDLYTLMGTYSHLGAFWVVGKIKGLERKFEKVSVISMEDDQEARKLLNMSTITDTYLL